MARSAADRLLKWLETEGITFEDFGERVGTGKSSVSYWTRGERVPGAYFAARIEQMTGIPVSAWPRSRE